METATPVQREADTEPMLIERLLPEFDATRTEHLVVSGDVDKVFDATRKADFMRAWKDSAAVQLLFGLRGLAERLVATATQRRFEQPPEPDRLQLADMPTHGDWVLLGENHPVEIAFGVIGRFWGGQTTWEQIDARDFATFDRPGFGKVACNFSLRPYGPRHTLVSYEARTKATDPEARRGFLRYWRPLAPFIGFVMRSQLRVIDDEARMLLMDDRYPSTCRGR